MAVLSPPLQPMLAKLARELPRGDYLYEPKWDGFRALVFRDGDAIDIRSRNDRPLARYFPELVGPLLALPHEQFVLDGEIVADEFAALLLRLHPAASRVERLRAETPASLVCFDLLALDGNELLARSFAERRALLEELLRDARAPLHLTPLTDDVAQAREWLERHEGVIAKRRDLPYEPGVRAMIKVKHERTVDCVVAGFRFLTTRPAVSSLLLGLYDESGELRHVGIASSFGEQLRGELLERVSPHVVELADHPWQHGFESAGAVGRLRGSGGHWTPDMERDWVPLAPELVAEVAYDALDGAHFRHPARFRRWRPDRDPRSCTLDELAPIEALPLP